MLIAPSLPPPACVQGLLPLLNMNGLGNPVHPLPAGGLAPRVATADRYVLNGYVPDVQSC
eukprot:7238511-Pyramimonas_sp.AAC.1